MGQGKKKNNLYREVCSSRNLYLSAKKAIKGKRSKLDIQEFIFHTEENLYQLRQELIDKTYLPGTYRTFKVYDPKERLISAAPFRDRVVHHALTGVIEPLFERIFSPFSFANRKGMGVHSAINLAQGLSRKYPYYLKGDIQKYFPSIDHEILKGLVRKKIACRETLWLIDLIIDRSNPQEEVSFYFAGDSLFTLCERRRGLPLGNQTSQFFANVYLNPLDQFVTRVLKAPGYVRYVDDFVVFGNSREEVSQNRREIVQFLERLRLRIHPRKCQIHRTEQGMSFLGFRLWPSLRRILNRKVVLFMRRLKKKRRDYRKGNTPLETVHRCLQGWICHAKHGDTKELRKDLLKDFVL